MNDSRCARLAGTVVGLCCLIVSAIPASAQQLSERSVRTLMDYAWNYTPAKFTPPSGKTVFIDKKNKAKMIVPVAKARAVIMAGRLTAHAQICDLPEEQVKNYHSLMLRSQRSKKWTPQQLVYINQLHLTTVMMLVGKLQIVENKGEKSVKVKDGKSNSARTCTVEQKSKVKELITAYVTTGPKINKTKTVPVRTGPKKTIKTTLGNAKAGGKKK